MPSIVFVLSNSELHRKNGLNIGLLQKFLKQYYNSKKKEKRKKKKREQISGVKPSPEKPLERSFNFSDLSNFSNFSLIFIYI